MTFHERGFRSIAVMGVPATDSAAGNARQWHTFVTNDDLATIEAANYFDALLTPKRVKHGDALTVMVDLDGTPAKRDYYFDITSSAGHVLIKREGGAAGKGLATLAFFLNLPDIAANADMLTDYVPGYNFKLEAFDFRVQKPATTGAKAATINLEIGTVNVTGGVIALTSANCTPAGAVVAGSAITAANTGLATDAISIESSGVTAFVEGSGWLLLRIRNTDE